MGKHCSTLQPAQIEAAVLAVAEEKDARLVVIDEKRARRFAERMGFALTGTLGVLITAKEAGLVSSIAGPIARLQESGLFLSQDLVRQALRLAGEEF